MFVFPTSTGEPGYETRDQDALPAFRYDPALDNGGWHDSTRFPAAADNPLNGNMYKPIYFDDGQAIHGANNVPPAREQGLCAAPRRAPGALDGWLGLGDVTSEIRNSDRISVTVNAQGSYVP